MKKGLMISGIIGCILVLSGCEVRSVEVPQVDPPQVADSPAEDTPSVNASTVNTPVLDSKAEDVTEGGKYRLIEVDGGDVSGEREAEVVVNVGFGDREYYAYTNAYGQLVRVIAKEIILQDDDTEAVNENGRYFKEEAFVAGTESKDLDQGHVIADSLGGCKNFEAIITYPDKKTQIPSRYQYTYTVTYDGKDHTVEDAFDNVNPDEVNAPLNEKVILDKDLSQVDSNGDGKVTIKEAKAAGYKMPIKKGHWLYKYMKDADGDGMVGE